MAGADDIYINEILRLEPLLRAYLHKFAPRLADLDDLMQETYARLLGVAPQERLAIKSTQAFALTTARNIAVDWVRRSKTVPFDFVEDLEALNVSQNESSVEQLVNAHQELVRLARAVATLPQRCAQVFTLRKVYGLTQEEIATHFGISVSTVENQLVKAVKRCKEYAEREAAAPAGAAVSSRRHGRRWPWKRKP